MRERFSSKTPILKYCLLHLNTVCVINKSKKTLFQVCFLSVIQRVLGILRCYAAA